MDNKDTSTLPYTSHALAAHDLVTQRAMAAAAIVMT